MKLIKTVFKLVKTTQWPPLFLVYKQFSIEVAWPVFNGPLLLPPLLPKCSRFCPSVLSVWHYCMGSWSHRIGFVDPMFADWASTCPFYRTCHHQRAFSLTLQEWKETICFEFTQSTRAANFAAGSKLTDMLSSAASTVPPRAPPFSSPTASRMSRALSQFPIFKCATAAL